MSFEAELKKFELSSVFTIHFSWLKRYVESDNGMYVPIKGISDESFSEIENSFYALQATWKAWREAKAQAVPQWVSVNDQMPPIDETVLVCWDYAQDIEPEKEYVTTDENLDEYWPNCQDEPPTHWMPLPKVIEAQEPTND